MKSESFAPQQTMKFDLMAAILFAMRFIKEGYVKLICPIRYPSDNLYSYIFIVHQFGQRAETRRSNRNFFSRLSSLLKINRFLRSILSVILWPK